MEGGTPIYVILRTRRIWIGVGMGEASFSFGVVVVTPDDPFAPSLFLQQASPLPSLYLIGFKSVSLINVVYFVTPVSLPPLLWTPTI